MKRIYFRKLILFLTLVGRAYSSQVIYAGTVNNDKIHTSEEAVNEEFIKQFPYAEQFIDKDGVTARRIKAPNIADRFLKKGEIREKIRRINLKYKNTDKTFSRIYQTLRYFGTYESEKGIPEIVEKQEFTYEVGIPEENQKEEILEGKITPEIHEKGDLEGAKSPILEVPEEPKEEITKEKAKKPETTIPETTITEEKKVPQLPQTEESVDGGTPGLAFASLIAAMLILKKTLKEYKK